MENEVIDTDQTVTEIKPDSSSGKTALPAILVFCSVFVLYYAAMSFLSPGKEISVINSKFGKQQSGYPVSDNRIYSDSSFVRMNREKAWLESQIIMAESDSICLALNLADSSAILAINGVSVHKSRITGKKISKVFYRADEYAVTSMLSSPFIIRRDIGTIQKEPLMIKMAPKDTSEYKPDVLPDTTHLANVNYILEMENGVRLYVYQETGKKEGGRLSLLLFDIKDRFRNIRDILKSIMVLKVPEYHPYIKIRLPKDDARFIYRAIPKHGQIAVFL
jgi:hypothetical protein